MMHDIFKDALRPFLTPVQKSYDRRIAYALWMKHFQDRGLLQATASRRAFQEVIHGDVPPTEKEQA